MKFFIVCVLDIAVVACFTNLPPGRWLANKYAKWYSSQHPKLLSFLGSPLALSVYLALGVASSGRAVKFFDSWLSMAVSFVVILFLAIIACAASQTQKSEKQEQHETHGNGPPVS